MLEFTAEELSGLQMATGSLGDWWVCDCMGGGFILELITGDAAGPITESMGDFKTTEEAIAEANYIEGVNQQVDDRGNEK